MSCAAGGRSFLHIPPEGLPGLRDRGRQGRFLGEVTDVLDGGTPILRVGSGKEETLIPFAETMVRKIDLDGRRIEVKLPEGLRELNK